MLRSLPRFAASRLLAGSGFAALAWRRSAHGEAAAPAPLLFLCESSYMPADDKPISKDGSGARGEDAHFCGPRALGVADGVGGWSELGVDSGTFARKLMADAAVAAQRAASGDGAAAAAAADPLPLLKTAHAGVGALAGASTALVATTGACGALRVVSLGDSGLALWRRSRAGAGGVVAEASLPVAEAARLWSRVASTTPQTFAFNAPLQLERGFNGHRPDQAQVLSLAPAPGDLVVAATDGLHDNLFPDAQAALLAKFDWAPCAALVHAATRRRAEDAAAATRAAGGEPPLQRLRLLNTAEAPVSDAELAERERLCRATLRGMAAMLAAHAHRVGHDPHAGDTPFAREAAKARKRFSGGKPDDVTVVVAMLLPDVGGAD
jgi:serine/threonine protein phosphatase PrpC